MLRNRDIAWIVGSDVKTFVKAKSLRKSSLTTRHYSIIPIPHFQGKFLKSYDYLLNWGFRFYRNEHPLWKPEYTIYHRSLSLDNGTTKSQDILQQEHLTADVNTTVRRPIKKNGTKYWQKWGFPQKSWTENQTLDIFLLQNPDSQLSYYRTQAAFLIL